MLCTVAGDPKAVVFVLPILEFLGRAVIQMGPDVQQGEFWATLSSLAISPRLIPERLEYRSVELTRMFRSQGKAARQYDAIREYSGVFRSLHSSGSYRVPRRQATSSLPLVLLSKSLEGTREEVADFLRVGHTRPASAQL